MMSKQLDNDGSACNQRGARMIMMGLYLIIVFVHQAFPKPSLHTLVHSNIPQPAHHLEHQACSPRTAPVQICWSQLFPSLKRDEVMLCNHQEQIVHEDMLPSEVLLKRAGPSHPSANQTSR